MNFKRICFFVFVWTTGLMLDADLLYAQNKRMRWQRARINFKKGQGLPTNLIYTIIADQRGELWMGTDMGVIRFDGLRFQQYNVTDGIPSNDVFQLFCDSKNRIWLSTFRDEICYIKDNQVFTAKNDQLLRQFSSGKKYPRFFEDSYKNIWVITSGTQVYRVDTMSRVVLFKTDLNRTGASAVMEYKDTIWVFGSANYWYVSGASDLNPIALPQNDLISVNGMNIHKDTCYYFTENNMSCLPASEIRRFALRKDRLWLPIHDQEMFRISGQGYLRYQLPVMKVRDTLIQDGLVSSLTKSRAGDLWISTHGNGVWRLLPEGVEQFPADFLDGGCSFSSILVTNRYVYAGTNHSEVFIFDLNGLQFLRSTKINYTGSGRNRILKFIPYKDQVLIVSDYVVGSLNQQFQFQEFADLKLGNKSGVVYGDTLMVLKHPRMLLFDLVQRKVVHSVEFGKRSYSTTRFLNYQWVGTEDSIYLVDRQFGPPQNPGFHFSFWANDLMADSNALYIASNERGLFIIQPPEVRRIGKEQGLSSNLCRQVIRHGDELFLATNHGIQVVHLRTGKIKGIYESDGLPSNSVQRMAISTNYLYAACDDGLFRMDLNIKRDPVVFPFFVSTVTVNTKNWDPGMDEIVAHTGDIIHVQLKLLTFHLNPGHRYYYRMPQEQDHFIQTFDPDIRVVPKHSGKRTLEFYATTAEGYRTRIQTLQLDIRPYWYQTTLFKVILALLMFSLLNAMILWSIRRVKMNEKRKAERIKLKWALELSKWKSAINPHFIFNSLNTLQSLNSSQDFLNANRFLSRFSRILRKAIDFSDRMLIPLNEEIDFITNFLELERIKKEEGFDFAVHVDERIPKRCYFPTLILQPLVENSVKYGIRQTNRQFIEIHFEWTDSETLTCIVRDYGPGMKENHEFKTDSRGIALVKKKLGLLEQVTGKAFIFHIHNIIINDKIQGVECKLRIPLIETDYHDKDDYN